MKTSSIADCYTFGRKLGAGGFGVTHVCTEIRTGEEYACKIISKQNLTSEEDKASLEREIEILELIIHPNIVHLHDRFEDDNFVYVVMELCKGGTVLDALIDGGACDEPAAARIIYDLACALAMCHKAQIVHGDVKLANLVFESEGDLAVKLIDFGLAQYIFGEGDFLTTIVGTAVYTAPEVVQRHYGEEADIWSMGVVLYALLSGRHPFESGSWEEVYQEIMQDNGELYHLFDDYPWQRISSGAKDLVRRMLTIDVKHRLTATQVLMHPWIQQHVEMAGETIVYKR